MTYGMKSANSPIGLIDSGIGGLTVAQSIKTLMPSESMIYFADTAHLPYGNKSASFIRSRTQHIISKLENLGCKMIVIACNSASAHYFVPPQCNIPVMGVIAPTIAELEKSSSNIKKIGLIGTHATIQSGAYSNLASPTLKRKLSCLATPLLAPMIEDNASYFSLEQTILDYFSQPELCHIQQLVLACTHYPIIRETLSQLYPSPIEVVDTPTIVAQAIYERLATLNLFTSNNQPRYQFLMSDKTERFETLAKTLFNDTIELTAV